LKQLVQEQPSISKDVRSLYDRHIRKGTRPNIDEYAKVLQSEMGRYPKTFLIIDALDECSEEARRTLQTKLREFQAVVNLNLMITSRPQVNVKKVFEEAILLEVVARDEDVRSYLQERIPATRLAQDIAHDIDLQESILGTITWKAGGMYV
jgi:hypothetical protein